MGVHALITTAGVSFLITLLLLPRLADIASRIGLIDQPTRRKIHRSPKPLVGGIGIIAGFTIASLIFIPLTSFRGFYTGLIILMISGFLDDYKELTPRLKFIFQIAAAMLMTYLSNNVLYTFGDLFSIGEIEFSIVALPVTVFCTVGIINAINMIDGLDGLAGGLSFVSLVAFSMLAYLNGQNELMIISMALAAAVLAFLRYNCPPASLFMGDAGSLSLGFALVYISIALTQWKGSRVAPVIPLLVLAVPIVDTVTIMIRRILRGRSPFEADRYHTHHILLRLGLGKETAAKVLIGISIIMSSIAIFGVIKGVPEHWLFVVFVFYFLLCFTLSFYIKESLMLRARFRRKRACAGYWLNNILMVLVRILIRLKILRRQERYIVSLRLTCMDQNNRSFKGRILNISKGGLCAEMNELILHKDSLRINIKLPRLDEDKPLNASAEIVWLSKADSGYKYGLRFLNLSKGQQAVLYNFLESLKEREEIYGIPVPQR